MIELEEFLLNIKPPEELASQIDGGSVSFYDLCKKKNITDEVIVNLAALECEQDESFCLPDIAEKCDVSMRPLDFVYDRFTDEYDLDQFPSDLHLIGRVQTGKGDSKYMYYPGKNLYPQLFFAGTQPAEVTQNFTSGRNDLYAASATRFAYTIDS